MADDQPLNTGWGPHVPSSDNVLLAQVRNIAARLEHQSTSCGRPFARWDDAAAGGFGGPSVWSNFAVLLAPVPDADSATDVAKRLVDFYGDRPFILFSPQRAPDLSPYGFTLVGHPPSMVRAPGGTAPAPPAELTIDEVIDDAGMADVAEVLIEGFGMHDLRDAPFEQVYGDARALGSFVRTFVGRVDGRAVCTATSVVAEGLLQVEGVAALPEVQGNGYGAAITWAATLAEPSLAAVLIASDAGRPVYERMGYLPLVRFDCWARPAP